MGGVWGVGAGLLTAGCSSSPNAEPAQILGQKLPTVRGESLDQQQRTLPDDLAGKPAILLVGYKQNAQFDCDRWVLGLLQAQTPADIYEVPAIAGLFPRLFAPAIDRGMQRGIPAELWPSVITVYRDAHRLEQLTGTTHPNNMRVLLLDAQGHVRWFHDRGYSPQHLLQLDAAVRVLASPS
ncbi:MAG: hypothetical protein HRU70_00115 [Phycisphaeraceae bacterium]|nr:MAG: hypothetical protein HRU70_00115 [Phycisphaeraceae bacterium]